MSSGTVRAVFLDAGGTLIHLQSGFLLQLLAEHGVFQDEASYRAADRVARRAVLTRFRDVPAPDDAARWRFYGEAVLSRLGCPPQQLDSVYEALLHRHQQGLLWTRAEPETGAVIRSLHDLGYTVGVISNADGRIASFLNHAGLAPLLDFIIDSAVVGVAKPDPGIFQLACLAAGVAPEQAVHVGDVFEIDVVGARRAGVLPILFDPADLQQDADCARIRSLTELIPWLRDWDRAAPAAPEATLASAGR